MDKNHFIAGVCEKYDPRLLKNRLNIEGNVISVLWKDPLLLDDNESLTEGDFCTKDGRLLFGIAKTLRSKGIGSFDEVVVNTYLDKDTLEKLDDVGGYGSVSKLVDIANFLLKILLYHSFHFYRIQRNIQCLKCCQQIDRRNIAIFTI